ncbi:MAG: class I SAM-dependent methyltransferase, partial [Phycisphaerae bacterium]
PGLVALERIVGQYRGVAVKLSPGADFDELPFECEVELISERGECRQAVAWTGGFREVHRRATVLPSGESLSARPGELLDWPDARPPEVGEWLYEPDPAVIRAGLVGVLARRLGLVPVDGHIAWLTGAGPIHNGLMHSFRVLDLRRWSARPVRAWLARHDVGPLEVKTRGFAAAPEAVLKRLRPAGQRPAVLFLTRLGERPTAILAERPQPPDSAFGSS